MESTQRNSYEVEIGAFLAFLLRPEIGRCRFWLRDLGQQETNAAMQAQDEGRPSTPLRSYFWLIYADFPIGQLTGYATICMAISGSWDLSLSPYEKL